MKSKLFLGCLLCLYTIYLPGADQSGLVQGVVGKDLPIVHPEHIELQIRPTVGTTPPLLPGKRYGTFQLYLSVYGSALYRRFSLSSCCKASTGFVLGSLLMYAMTYNLPQAGHIVLTSLGGLGGGISGIILKDMPALMRETDMCGQSDSSSSDDSDSEEE